MWVFSLLCVSEGIHQPLFRLVPSNTKALSYNNMRILQLASSYPLDEKDTTAPFVRSIARSLADRGHEIHLLVPERNGAPKHSAEPGITVDWIRYAPMSRLRIIGHAQSLRNDMHLKPEVWPALPLYLGSQFLAGHNLCVHWKPDIIHVHWVLPNGPVGALLAWEFNLPLVINLHGSDTFMALRSKAFTKVARWTFSKARAIVAPSPELCEGALRLGARPERIYLQPHGVNLDQFCPPTIENDKLVIVYAGRLVPKKGIDVLLACAPVILKEYPTAEIWIAGYGDQLADLEAQRAALPSTLRARVLLLGQVAWDKMPDLLQHASIFVAPSVRDSAGNQDGLPTVILEAMACGCPIVASNIAGIPIVVKHGQNGLLTPPGDQEALVRSLSELLSSAPLRQSMGRMGRQIIEQGFTWKTVAQRLDDLFISITH